MAGDAAGLRDSVQHDVAVTIEPDFADLLRVARFLALAPEPVARSRPVDRAPRLRRLRERLAIGPGEHQHAPAGRVLRDDRHQAVGIEANLGEPVGIVHVSVARPPEGADAPPWGAAS